MNLVPVYVCLGGVLMFGAWLIVYALCCAAAKADRHLEDWK